MMELSGSSYNEIIQMPVNDITEYLEWKIKFDKERKKNQMKAVDGIV